MAVVVTLALETVPLHDRAFLKAQVVVYNWSDEMNQEKFIEELLAATDFQVPVVINMDTELRNLPEWDSLAALGVIVMFDMQYKKVITGDHLHKAVTVGDLYRLVG